MLFSTIIIAVAFLPLFTMTGVEGVIYSPMARTYAFAIRGAILLSFTLTPVLAAIFLKSKVPGVKDLGMFQSLGQTNIKITPDRVQIARYGLNTGDVEAVVQAAIGGQAVTQVFEGEKRFDLTVRWLEPSRSNLREIRNITVPTPDGANIPLTKLARIEEEVGPSITAQPQTTTPAAPSDSRST